MLEPKLDKLSATFAAPPSRISSFEGLRTGTGASGETLSTFPDIYLSKIMSPKTRTFPFDNILRFILTIIIYLEIVIPIYIIKLSINDEGYIIFLNHGNYATNRHK